MNAIANYNAIRDREAGYSHAQITLGLIERHNPNAVSLSMGYLVSRDNSRVNFSDHYGNRSWDAPRVMKETRNKRGRCTSLTAVYSDGSKLRYTWSERNGPRYRVVTP